MSTALVPYTGVEPRRILPAPTLGPIAFGQRDPLLGKAVLAWIAHATPPVVIYAHPATQARVRSFLTHLFA